MRFLSGKYKGRTIEGYAVKGTRPTMDRVKESLFAMIQSKVKESVILDLFAGTGSLGLEGVSVGASFCYLVDHNPICIQNISKTIQKCQIENVKTLKLSYQKALDFFVKKQQKFDIIFLDPPYEENLVNGIVSYIYEKNLLNEKGIIVCEYEREKVENTCFPIYKEKKYGSKKIKIYINE